MAVLTSFDSPFCGPVGPLQDLSKNSACYLSLNKAITWLETSKKLWITVESFKLDYDPNSALFSFHSIFLTLIIRIARPTDGYYYTITFNFPDRFIFGNENDKFMGVDMLQLDPIEKIATRLAFMIYQGANWTIDHTTLKDYRPPVVNYTVECMF